MVPLLVHVIKLTKRAPRPIQQFSRAARLDGPAEVLSYRARLRRRIRQPCVNELSEREASPAERARDEDIFTSARCGAGEEFLRYSDRAPGVGVQK